jgi:hypothetical protein
VTSCSKVLAPCARCDALEAELHDSRRALADCNDRLGLALASEQALTTRVTALQSQLSDANDEVKRQREIRHSALSGADLIYFSLSVSVCLCLSVCLYLSLSASLSHSLSVSVCLCLSEPSAPVTHIVSAATVHALRQEVAGLNEQLARRGGDNVGASGTLDDEQVDKILEELQRSSPPPSAAVKAAAAAAAVTTTAIPAATAAERWVARSTIRNAM